jgi:protein-disulfide isomerase
MTSSEARIEKASSVNYNGRVSRPRISGHLIVAMIAAPLLMGGACEKKPAGDNGAIGAADRAGSGVATPIDTTPLKGIEVKLEGDKAQLFYKLLGTLKSPCGKTESLRKSFTDDSSCKRAPFAVRYVLAMVEDEVTEDQARDEYTKKYQQPKVVKIDVSRAPHFGNEDAPIRFAEFFDYECPHCQAFKPMLEQIAQQYEGKTVEYFLMYPLEAKHPGSKVAAQAALAAAALGKFKEMHDVLFAKSPAHSPQDVLGYAKEMGLDEAKFQAAYAAAEAQVKSDQAQGEALGVDSTPTLFFNDRKYEGPFNPKYIAMWIDEELAVNR